LAEPENQFVSAAVFEHTFWLSVLRDHTEFIYMSLGPDEQREIATAKAMHQEAIALFEKTGQLKNASVEDVRTFTLTAIEYTKRVLQFKQYLLDRTLACRITLHLSPTLIDHMVREGQEYLNILHMLLQGRELTGAQLAIHEANLWLPDASGHAAAIRSGVDPQEDDIFEAAHNWKVQFDDLTIHLAEIQTKLRSEIRWVPSLKRLMEMTTEQITLFRGFLCHLEETLAECRALSTLKPLMMDHMAREAAYFLEKLERARQ
jgi:hypothetical protein